MISVATTFDRIAAPPASRWRGEARRLQRAVVDALDRLVPARGPGQRDELPAEWFKFPPR